MKINYRIILKTMTDHELQRTYSEINASLSSFLEEICNKNVINEIDDIETLTWNLNQVKSGKLNKDNKKLIKTVLKRFIIDSSLHDCISKQYITPEKHKSLYRKLHEMLIRKTNPTECNNILWYIIHDPVYDENKLDNMINVLNKMESNELEYMIYLYIIYLCRQKIIKKNKDLEGLLNLKVNKDELDIGNS